jgi:hypothetical protein
MVDVKAYGNRTRKGDGKETKTVKVRETRKREREVD